MLRILTRLIERHPLLLGVGEAIGIGLQGIRAYKMRAFLTILGVVMGIMTVTGMSSIVAGLNASMAKQIESLGSSVIFIRPFGPGENLTGEQRRRRKGLTLPEVEALARSFANQCEKIIASAGSLTVSMVKQWHLPVAPWDKKQLLLHLLTHEEPALTVVFCRTKKTVDNIAEYLQRKGVDCHAIHGDMYQNKRNKVMEQLRAGKLEVLIASDVASRGLDVEGITHVINYDLPEDPDLYVHRIGRTARAGREGVAWSLVTPEQGGLLTEIELLINAEIPKLDYPDFKPGPIPQGVLESKQVDANRAQRAKQFNRFSSALGPAQPAPAAPQPSGGGAPAAGAGGGGAYPSAGAGHTPAFSPPDADAARFPGGIIPTKAPPKRMFGRVKTARSMKAAMQQSFTPQANPAPQPDAAPPPAAPAAAPPAD
jgi:hypothetical protein